MNLFDYIVRASWAWFVGFFPLAEIYVAIPAALATGLDPVSVVVWSVLGNFTPLLLIHFFYEQLVRNERIRGWLQRLYSPKFKESVDKHGIWFVLLATPWIGVWAMGVTAKLLGMNVRTLLWSSFASILVYGIVLVWMIQAGVSVVSG